MPDHIYIDRWIARISTEAAKSITNMADEVTIVATKQADHNAVTELGASLLLPVTTIDIRADIPRMTGDNNRLFRCSELKNCPKVLTDNIIKLHKEQIAKAKRLHIITSDGRYPQELYDYAIERKLDICIYNAKSTPHAIDTLLFTEDELIANSRIPDEDSNRPLTRPELDALIVRGVDITQANVSEITDFSALFDSNTTFNQDISGWDVSSATNMRAMFKGAFAFNQDIGNWDVINVLFMDEMFGKARDFNQDITSWNTKNVTNMDNMFAFAESFYQDLTNWDVRSCARYINFAYTTPMWQIMYPIRFRDPTRPLTRAELDHEVSRQNDVTNADVSLITNFGGVFRDQVWFNQPIGAWNTRAATNMSNMFRGAKGFNHPIEDWDVGGVGNMTNMFRDALNFDQELDRWDVRNVRDTKFENMFRNAQAFNRSLRHWGFHPTVESLNRMFLNAARFNQDLRAWNTREIRTMNGTFRNCERLVADLNGWDVANVTSHINFADNTEDVRLPDFP